MRPCIPTLVVSFCTNVLSDSCQMQHVLVYELIANVHELVLVATVLNTDKRLAYTDYGYNTPRMQCTSSIVSAGGHGL